MVRPSDVIPLGLIVFVACDACRHSRSLTLDAYRQLTAKGWAHETFHDLFRRGVFRCAGREGAAERCGRPACCLRVEGSAGGEASQRVILERHLRPRQGAFELAEGETTHAAAGAMRGPCAWRCAAVQPGCPVPVREGENLEPAAVAHWAKHYSAGDPLR